MDQAPVRVQLDLEMDGAAVKVEAVRAQEARQVDKREPVNTNCRVNYPVLFNPKLGTNYA